MPLDQASLKNWIPYKLMPAENDLLCDWLYVANQQFKESLFVETISKCKQLPENLNHQKNITSLSSLLEWSKTIDAVEPSTFIFHVSRCGSTMVSQLLAIRDEHMVLSEVPFFDDVLRMPGKGKFENAALLKEVIEFYCQKRNGTENKVFIKTDSWHIVFYKEIRRMFPHVPFILLYRRPDEVVKSLNRAPGIHCIPQFIAPEFFDIKDEIITTTDFYDYPIKVIEKYMEAYIDVVLNDSNSFLLNYKQGMLKIMEEIRNIVGIKFTEWEWERMKERLFYHSKYPGVCFSYQPAQPNSDEKFSRAFQLYNRLEELRTGR